MQKIYLDYNSESVFTFPLDMGPEPEGPAVVDRKGLSSQSRRAEALLPLAAWRGNAPKRVSPQLNKTHLDALLLLLLLYQIQKTDAIAVLLFFIL